MGAFPPVNASTRNASCVFYEYKGDLCDNITTSLYVYGDQSILKFGERETESTYDFLKFIKPSPKCLLVVKDLLCHYYFPSCDESLGMPTKRRICSSSCDYLVQVACEKEMVKIRDVSSLKVYMDILDCSSPIFDSANGGNAPECYQWYDLPGRYKTAIIKSVISFENLPSLSGHVLLRVIERFGLTRVIVLFARGKIYCSLWCLSLHRCIS